MSSNMVKHRKFFRSLAAGLALLSVALAVRAQDDDEDQPNPKARPKSQAKASSAPSEPNTPEEHAARALLETRIETPTQIVRAIGILIDLRQVEAARPLLEKLQDSGLDDAGWAALGREFGLGAFLKMANQDSLLPEARQVVEKVRDAVRKNSHDPAAIAKAIKRLSDKSEYIQAEAMTDLKEAGSVSVAALVSVLADSSRGAEHSIVRDALVVQGEATAAPVLVAALDSPDPALQTQAIEVLGRLRSIDSASHLLAPAVSPHSDRGVSVAAQNALEQLTGRVPSLNDAATMLYNQARSYYEQRRPLHPDPDDRVELWSWDAGKKRPVSKQILSADASLAIAARLARDLDGLLPDSRATTRLYLGSLLESATFTAGLDQPLPRGEGTAFDIAAGRGVEDNYDLLRDSLHSGHLRAATAAAQILAEIGSSDLLYREGARPSVLIRAIRSPDRRLRFAALAAIMRFQPTLPYPGSSDVLDSLLYFAGATGEPRALVADTRFEAAQTLAGMLREQGYEVEIATSGEELLQVAPLRPYELALIDATLPRWPIDQVLQRFRLDGRSGATPIGLIAPLGHDERAVILARRDPLTQVWVRPADLYGMQVQADRLLHLSGRIRVTNRERVFHTRQSLEWLAELTAQQDSLYLLRRSVDVAVQGLNVPDLFPIAIAILEKLPLPEAQRALVDQASQTVLPLAGRRAAAEAFQRSLTAYGPMLTTAEIELQYDRYNESEPLNQDTQNLLAFILDCLEAGRTPPQNVPPPAIESLE